MTTDRPRDTMPVGEPGYHTIDAGPYLHVMFNKDRSRAHEPAGIVRPSIVIAAAGSTEQAIRLDPFSVGPHYHIQPVGGLGQISLEVEEGSTPLEAALTCFDYPDQLRALLIEAEEHEVADCVDDEHIVAVATQIRCIAA
ncbi:MAG: hypothetical protein Q7S95_00330 [bacterium]|nr:hypothetical protein [bacterium]